MHIKSIYQLGELLTNNILHGQRLWQLSDYIEDYDSDDWISYIKYSTNKSFHKINVYDNHIIKIFLICWNHKCETNIHKYPTNGTLVKVLDGTLLEDIYKLNDADELEKIESINLNTNDFSYNTNYQNITFKNLNYPTYSLHVFSIDDTFADIFTDNITVCNTEEKN